MQAADLNRVDSARIHRGRNPPARQGLVVTDPCVNPAGPFGRDFFLPERRLRLEVVHQKLACLEALSTMGRGHSHQHNLVLRLQQTHTVNDTGRTDIEAFIMSWIAFSVMPG